MHTEYFYERSPNAALNNRNQLEYWGANLWDLEHAPGCEPIATPNGASSSPAPSTTTTRAASARTRRPTARAGWATSSRPTSFEAGGHHEIAYGWHPEYVTFDQERWYSGPLGNRALIQLYPQQGGFNTLLLLHAAAGRAALRLRHRARASGPPPTCSTRPTTRTASRRTSSSIVNAFFLQENYSPPGLRNLTINAGARLELQKLYDFHGQAFLDATNVSPRIGAICDPLNDGRSKVSFFYGRYFEAIPLNVAARYFGGEGILQPQRHAVQRLRRTPNPYTWNGSAELAECNVPAEVDGDEPDPDGQRGGRQRPLQQRPELRRAVQPGRASTTTRSSPPPSARSSRTLTVRLDYQHRWLGTIIEDGAADPSLTFVLANPGHVPQSALDDAPKATATRRRRRWTRSWRWRSRTTRSCPALQSAATAAQAQADDAAGPGHRAQAGAHLRRHHGVGEQALLEELADARLVHVLAPDR